MSDSSKAPPLGKRVPAALLERLALAALLLLALVPRARELGAGFDRGVAGYQGAFFAIAAVNYERLGAGAAGGYPVLNVDLPGASPESALERKGELFVYTNHPPTMPLLAWTGVRVLGPAGWGEAWRSDSSPRGIELALRLPFLLLHMLGLLALWWIARVAFGAQVALITLALTVFMPISALYGTLVNYETPSLVFALFAVGCYGAYLRHGRTRELVGMGAGFAIGCSFTFAPAFFLPMLCVHSLLRRCWHQALRVGLVGGACALAPLALHSLWAGVLRERLGSIEGPLWSRVQVLVAPLLDGSVPVSVWAEAQVAHAFSAFGPALFAVSGVGLVLAVARLASGSVDAALRRGEWPRPSKEPIDLALPLFGGGLLYLFAFYRHTLEEQWVFLLYLAPGATLLAARALHATSMPLQRLRGGIAPLVLVVGTVMLFSLVRFEAWRAAERAPSRQDSAENFSTRVEAPLPETVGRELGQLLPPRTVGLHPAALGLNPAAAWYAWRSLLTAESPLDPRAGLELGRFGLGEAPRYFLLPDDPPDSVAPLMESLRPRLGEPDLVGANWKAWLLD
jgi:hypothetical protein